MKILSMAWMAMLIMATLSCGDGGGNDRPATNKPLTMKGSDTMVILGQRWAEKYMGDHPGTAIQVTGGGSGTGIAALINGATDICMSSRPMKGKERKQISEKSRQEVKEIAVALDGIAIYVNEANPLSEISIDQSRDIYLGKTTSWKALGGEEKQIVAYGRENNSGTYMYFKEHVLENKDFAAGVQTLPGTAAVVNAVSKDRYAIGYGGIAYAKGIKPLRVRKDESSEAIAPTMEHVVSGKYPISRSLYFYTAGEPNGTAKVFIEWALGADGQKICGEVGYYPLPKK